MWSMIVLIVNLHPDNRGLPPGLAGPIEERLRIMPAAVGDRRPSERQEHPGPRTGAG